MGPAILPGPPGYNGVSAAIKLGRCYDSGVIGVGYELLQAARTAAENGDDARAAYLLTKAVERQPDLREAWRERAVARSMLGDHKGAVEDLTQALKLDPSDNWSLHLRSRIKVLAGDQQGSLDDLIGVLKAEPELAVAWAERAWREDLLGRHDMALRCAQRAVSLDPDDVECRASLAMVLSSLGRFDESLVECQRIIESDATYLDVQVRRSQCLYMLRRFGEARDALALIVQDAGATGQDWFEYGRALVASGEYRAGIEALTKARELGEGAWVDAMMGVAWAHLSESARGRAMIDSALPALAAEYQGNGGDGFNLAFCHALRSKYADLLGIGALEAEADRAAASHLLARAIETDPTSLPWARCFAAFDGLWSRPELARWRV